MGKSSVGLIQLFNNMWLFRYLCPQKVMFDKISGFKQDFTPWLKGFDIKLVCIIIKNPQAKSLVEQVYQVLYNILVTKYVDNKLFYYIYTWDETLASI